MIIIIITYILNKKTYYMDKTTAIECGIEPFEENIGVERREKFYIKFYIIGITYLIFDLESILLYPITIYNSLGQIPIEFGPWNLLAITIFYIFIIIIIAGLYYEIKKDVLK